MEELIMDRRRINRTIIMQNYLHPTHSTKTEPIGYKKKLSTISTCADKFIIFVKIEDNKIEDILFTGEGCAISTASLNLMAAYLINKTKEEAIKYIENYRDFLMGINSDKNNLKDLIVFENINVHLNRVNCGLIGPNNILKILEGDHD
jgi:nitrogen fixation NifU-like protein